ncbi:uncharacterized protein BBA_04834 [Beauveria bassiana ARSEF 2860]|uniref:Uncharacterized protein n=1 Tax=Beauveria bassiana (strain ARSEF 2860) TaxID=655819 RepID=J5JV68_BEAB2|nr:uncharacterized protein BBA_04834 [Beauveria bassiana ARSEF 2860]EJP66341.1 hypothetical protein BBA_04834 [Beauveria bassiana ARSEF 2860]
MCWSKSPNDIFSGRGHSRLIETIEQWNNAQCFPAGNTHWGDLHVTEQCGVYYGDLCSECLKDGALGKKGMIIFLGRGDVSMETLTHRSISNRRPPLELAGMAVVPRCREHALSVCCQRASRAVDIVGNRRIGVPIYTKTACRLSSGRHHSFVAQSEHATTQCEELHS